MSSWDRSRNIPWSLVKQDGDADEHKEKVFRALQKQIVEQVDATDDPSLSSGEASDQQTKHRVPFATMDLLKNAAFGATIGSITGSVFGFMDSMRTAGESTVLKNASNTAKATYLFQGTTRSATLFGVFFGGFQVTKYGLRVLADPGEWAEIGVAGAISMGALMYKPSFRPSLPYAGMLVFMDGVQILMREWEK